MIAEPQSESTNRIAGQALARPVVPGIFPKMAREPNFPAVRTEGVPLSCGGRAHLTGRFDWADPSGTPHDESDDVVRARLAAVALCPAVARDVREVLPEVEECAKRFLERNLAAL